MQKIPKYFGVWKTTVLEFKGGEGEVGWAKNQRWRRLDEAVEGEEERDSIGEVEDREIKVSSVCLRSCSWELPLE